ncbi:Rho GTPase-activating gacO-like protein [Melia azedarach]|uniref:Rho GTPase-activating gacO-like protein n=1 Tax=Melia azedarach TaxID=155640 RepID=A0ACC1X3B0_MELAZ|nr:Rho GTPase-activating gacO-like protein [Melia azedarach]
MGRGRGKGKKPTIIASREDPASGEEEKLPSYRRRGRPQKPLKDGIEEEREAEKIEEDGDNPKGSISSKDTKIVVASANGRKRKRSTQTKDIIVPEKLENGIEIKSATDDSVKSVGFRQNGSRRKNKPRRAAEAGIECK